MREGKQGQRSEPLPSLERAAPTGRLEDAGSKKLENVAKKLGNDELQKRIDSGNATRDELLKFLVSRLQVVRDVQLREVTLSQKNANYDWWRLVEDRQRGIEKPDPTRWRDTARAYEEAAFHLCRGDVTRGIAEMKVAIEVEKRAFENLTRLVEVSERERSMEGPESLGNAGAAQAAGSCPPPEALDLAREIQNVTDKPPSPADMARVADPWWTEEEEEEEEGKPDEK
jgi:hypothetical protein